ncbi:MAG: hypothetical protein ACI85O_003887, partial [Saprospiraceae bacterium]
MLKQVNTKLTFITSFQTQTSPKLEQITTFSKKYYLVAKFF